VRMSVDKAALAKHPFFAANRVEFRWASQWLFLLPARVIRTIDTVGNGKAGYPCVRIPSLSVGSATRNVGFSLSLF
jgi:hypothetical protein